MSQWTHVHGLVRFHSLDGTEINDHTISRGMPTGSEGPLDFFIWIAPPSHLAKFTVGVWGDLRDYNDMEEVISYFNNLENICNIRDGVFEVYVEGGAKMSFQFDTEKRKFVRANSHLGILKNSGRTGEISSW
jgi:hypothetical protein